MLNSFDRLIKEQGLRCTRNRRDILELLDTAAGPMGVEELYLELKNRKKSMNLSTVYRALEVLEGSDLVNRVYLGEQTRMFYERNRKVHRHYLHCLDCGEVYPVEGCPLGSYVENLGKVSGYVMEGHRLDLYGHCPKCQDLEQKNP